MTPLKPLVDIPALDAAIAESFQRPVVLFKHSRTCGISCEALEELHAHVADATGHAVFKLITVQTHRTVADAVTARLGIRHESPQAIVLQEGIAVWHGSHFRITAYELRQVLASLPARSTPARAAVTLPLARDAAASAPPPAPAPGN